MGQPSVRRSAAKSCARLENRALQCPCSGRFMLGWVVRKGTVLERRRLGRLLKVRFREQSSGKQRFRRSPAAALSEVGQCRQHRRGALAGVEQQRSRGEPLVAGAQDIGRANIARSNRADVDAVDARQHQSEGHTAEQIADAVPE